MRLAALGLALAATGAVGEGRPTVAERVAQASLIAEVSVPLKAGEPAGPAKLVRVLFPPDSTVSELPADTLAVFPAGSRCWKKALGRDNLKAVLFLKGDVELKALAGPEEDGGRTSELHPAYAKLVDAVAQSTRWPEERMRAVGEAALWSKEKAALKQKANPYLRALAAAFLEAHGAAKVVDGAWGKPKSGARKKAEALAKEPVPEDACGG